MQDSEDNDTTLIGTKYTPKNPPELKSKYLQFLEALQNEEAKREVTLHVLRECFTIILNCFKHVRV